MGKKSIDEQIEKTELEILNLEDLILSTKEKIKTQKKKLAELKKEKQKNIADKFANAIISNGVDDEKVADKILETVITEIEILKAENQNFQNHS